MLMLAATTMAQSQRTTWSATASKILATMFAMTPMVGNWLHQIKVPRPDAYRSSEYPHVQFPVYASI